MAKSNRALHTNDSSVSSSLPEMKPPTKRKYKWQFHDENSLDKSIIGHYIIVLLFLVSWVLQEV